MTRMLIFLTRESLFDLALTAIIVWFDEVKGG